MLTTLVRRRSRYETFYGWHSSDGNFTNVGQSPIPKGLEEFYNATGKPGILELEGVFFTAATKPLRGMVMKPGGAAAWKTLAAEIKPLVEKKVIIGFMLGDEIVWNGVSWQDLNNTALLVKSTFPDAFLYYNEGGAPLWGNYNVNHKKTEYPHIPDAVDYVSTDDYGTINTGGMNASAIKKLANAPNQYKRFIYPRLLPHQKVFVVPQAYAGAITGYCPAVKSFSAPTPTDLAAMDDCLLNQTIGYLRWIDADDKIVGLDGFHLSTYGKAPGHVDYGVVSMPKTLECYMTLGDQLNGK